MKSDKKNILLIGGAGYIGQVLINYFLKKKYKIGVVDNLIYKHKLEKRNKVKFHNLSVDKINNITNDYENIVLLSGLVGDPITKKYPDISKKFNLIDIKKYLNQIKKQNKKLIFISTCSNYGLLENNKTADENFKLKPLSIYAKQKVNIENFLIKNKKKFKFNFTILRFATAFGLSPRMRFDLTVNQFVKEIYEKKKLNVYDLDTWRPYCHVVDFARLIEKVINSPEKIVKSQIFNAGNNKNNHTKRDILNKIIKYLKEDFSRINFNKNTKDKLDKRSYKVNFSKLKKKLNFQTKYNVNYGIKEIVRELKNKKFKKSINRYGNFKIEKKNY